MRDLNYIKIEKKPKRNYAELLADSSDFGSWEGETDTLTYEEKKHNKKKHKIKKLVKEITSYEF